MRHAATHKPVGCDLPGAPGNVRAAQTGRRARGRLPFGITAEQTGDQWSPLQGKLFFITSKSLLGYFISNTDNKITFIPLKKDIQYFDYFFFILGGIFGF